MCNFVPLLFKVLIRNMRGLTFIAAECLPTKLLFYLYVYDVLSFTYILLKKHLGLSFTLTSVHNTLHFYWYLEKSYVELTSFRKNKFIKTISIFYHTLILHVLLIFL